MRIESLTPPAGTPLPRVPALRINISVHDAARVEWVVALALPQSGARKYEIEFSVEVPANVYSRHDVWDHLQSFSRLQSPSEAARAGGSVDLDGLRRDTLGAVGRLKTQREAFERASTDAQIRMAANEHLALEAELKQAVTSAVAAVAEMRTILRPAAPEPAGSALAHERELADEFLSHQLIEFLSLAQGLFNQIRTEGSRMSTLDLSWMDRVHRGLAEALSEELAHRRTHQFVIPRATKKEELSKFVERGARLKKHFQDVLFLEPETRWVEHRLRNFIGACAAVLAAFFYIALQRLHIGSGTRAGLGVGTSVVLFTAAYTVKDRVKDMTRRWLAGGLTRIYGQRILKLRLPAKVDAGHPVLVDANESFDSVAGTATDELNAGRAERVMALRYRMRAEAQAAEALARARIQSIKHIFRYDLSPVFNRLDDAVKKVPVLDPGSQRMTFADAPKEYRFPLKLVVRVDDDRGQQFECKVVVSKRGIQRLEDLPETHTFESETVV